MTKKLTAALVLALASLALVACGGGDDAAETASDGGAPDGSTVAFEASADSGLAYTEEEATAEGGKVTIEFTNAQPVAHDVAIEDANGKDVAKTEIVTEDTTTTTANLKPGTYTFYCTVPGHREAGMEGTLTVE